MTIDPNSTPSDPFATPEGSAESSLELLFALLHRLRRHLWLALAVWMVVVAGVVAHTLEQPEFYESDVTMLLQNRPPRVMDKVTDVFAEEVMADADRFANGQVRLMQSELISNAVEKKLGLAAGSLAGRLEVLLDHNSHVVTLSVRDRDPQKAKQIVGAFADAYVASTVTELTGVATQATHFLDDEAGKERSTLEGDERALFQFQKSNELPASTFEDSHKIYSSNLEALHADEAQSRAAGIKLEAQLAEIGAAGNDANLKRMLALPAAGTQWGDLQAHRAQLLEQLQKLSATYGPEHPKVVETKKALAAVEAAMDEEAATAIAAVKARAHGNQIEQEGFRKAIAEDTRKAVMLRQKELEYNRLSRQLDEDRQAYTMVATRSHETQLQSLVRATFVRRLDGPSDGALIGRNLPRNVGMAILIGLVLGVALAIGVDLLDDSVKSPVEAERELEQPLLGIMMSIPAPRAAGDGPVDIEVARAEHLLSQPRSPIAEQCQSLATQIYSLFMDAPPRALMVVSSSVEDGKTLVTLNLAATLAARGKRVLIVDGDLRRGRLHKLFQLSRTGGLYELVTQKITLDEATRRTWIPNVDVITSGEVPEKLSPLRVFEHPELPGIVTALKARYDLVLFDTAPIPLVSDAILLGPLTDGALGVARARKTSCALTRKLGEQLRSARINLLGWVLNDISASEMSSRYYYRYGYARGYGYREDPPAETT